jgi:hypothetical protein
MACRCAGREIPGTHRSSIGKEADKRVICKTDHGEDADIDEPLLVSKASTTAAAASAKPKLSTEEQKKLLDERLAKMRAVSSVSVTSFCAF